MGFGVAVGVGSGVGVEQSTSLELELLAAFVLDENLTKFPDPSGLLPIDWPDSAAQIPPSSP